MALLFFDSFDHYTTSATLNTAPPGDPVIFNKWARVTSSVEIRAEGTAGASLVGFGGQLNINGKTLYIPGSLQPPATSLTAVYIRKDFTMSGNTLVFGFAFRTNQTAAISSPLHSTQFVTLYSNLTPILSLVRNVAGNIEIRDGDKVTTGSVYATGATVLSRSASNTTSADIHWYYIECKIVFAGASSTITVNLDGVEEIAATTVTIGPANANQLFLSSYYVANSTTIPNTVYDDLYLCDGSGALNNTFLGPCRIDILLPNSDVVPLGWTYPAANAYGSLIHSVRNDGGSPTVITGSTLNSINKFNIVNLSTASQPVHGIQISSLAKRNAGNIGIAPILDNGTDPVVVGSTFNPSVTYTGKSWLFEADPASVAWTETSVNNLKVGLKITE